MNTLKYFRILFRIRWEINENVLIPRYAALRRIMIPRYSAYRDQNGIALDQKVKL
jgi:hypothetical protein